MRSVTAVGSVPRVVKLPVPEEVVERYLAVKDVGTAEYRPNADAYLFSVRGPIPNFPLPLRPHEDEPLVLLNQVLHTLYDEAGYDLAVDYTQSPIPPLRDEDAEWASELVRQFQSE